MTNWGRCYARPASRSGCRKSSRCSGCSSLGCRINRNDAPGHIPPELHLIPRGKEHRGHGGFTLFIFAEHAVAKRGGRQGQVQWCRAQGVDHIINVEKRDARRGR